MVEFRLNHKGMEELIASLPAPAHVADKVAEQARLTAPYAEHDKDDKDQRHYRNSIETGEYFDVTSQRHTAYVVATVPWATKVEVRHRTLANALSTSELL